MTYKEKELYDAIDEILWKDWNPININDNENIRDEYQSYTPHVFKLKIQGADIVKIARHLYNVETINIGLAGNPEHCKIIAKKIYEL
ncbi:hypothetical protein D0T84_06475 [Dysgonomonas sp. 521]|uniref:hypothetical protein n=1 Tax=Dysgonomonas sp. 521 TaxID=2302932 RepID=UPI0013D4D14D|nr:hypothetical protein [Dysgonomonas sp. 521]NDV94567.1 hypothetical protein [Dysgonomonas sp. 521]